MALPPCPAVAIMQPTFLPWQGYFALIDAADIFIFLDDAQFLRRSFHHRNRLFVSGGNHDWISLPVEHAGQRTALNQTRVSLDPRFVRKTLSMIEQTYRRTPFFDLIFPLLFDWLVDENPELLADRNISLITALARMMGIAKNFLRSSALDVNGIRSRLLLNILETVGAGNYLSASGSFDYMRADGLFGANLIPVTFQDFAPQPYPQRQSSSFVPYLSVIDALFQLGPEATLVLIRNGAKQFLTWDERAALSEPCVAPEDSVCGWPEDGKVADHGCENT